MSAWARPGVKCVCVKVLPSYHSEGWAPVLGTVYTVREVCRHYPGVALEEFVNPDGFGPYWVADQFRPLITRTQEDDVRLIKSLLVGDEVDA